jgi:hypothetical protein
MSKTTDPPDSDLGPQEVAAEPASTERLQHALGPRELRSGLLALLVPRGSHRTMAAWLKEIEPTPYAVQLKAEAMALPGASRLPWFELLLVRMAGQPLAERQALLESARRVMAARGTVQPLDTLHYLVMRRGLGRKTRASGSAEGRVGFSLPPEAEVRAIARYSAFLSRLIPAGSADGSAGADWYASVMQRWGRRVDMPQQLPLPDTDSAVKALHRVAALPMMQRPVLVRDWVSAALRLSAAQGGAAPSSGSILNPRSGLCDLSADALRLSATLLDTPLPPELARHYIEL